MPILKNNQHEKFAVLQAGGMCAADAHREAGFKNKNHPVAACALNRRQDIQDRILEIKTEAAKNVIISKEEYLQIMTGILKAKPDEAAMDNPLCELKYVGKEAEAVAVFPSKIAAGDSIAKTMGWHKETVKLEASEQLVNIVQSAFR